MFHDYVRELRIMRGTTPSDLIAIGHAVRAAQQAEVNRMLADSAIIEGDMKLYSQLAGFAQRETRLHSQTLASLGLRANERGIKRTKEASAKLTAINGGKWADLT